MKIRIKFTKSGPLKFIGHLDVMRYFQKAFRRAEIDVEYSQGFNPHQIMSFAAPLGVGLTSDGEYLDASLHSCDSPDVMIKRINEVMAEDIQVVDFVILPDDSKNSMSIVAAADYMVSLKDGYDFMELKAFHDKFTQFINSEQILINKKSKKSENIVDIKPLIYHTAYTKENFLEHISQSRTLNDIYSNTTVADQYENGVKVYMTLATGSVNNLKPELVMEAFCGFVGIEYNEYAYQVHRMEVYANLSDETKDKLVPLNKVM